MGYTPLEGLVMATRCGSVDPGLLLELMREGYSEDEIAGILQKESGLKGCPTSAMTCVKSVLPRSTVTTVPSGLGGVSPRLLQVLGSMAASLGGVDVLALTGGIGEHDKQLHQELTTALDWWQNSPPL